jgi:DNA-directed RNA polymerase subunit M/transcription elongation factor TFIIS
MSQPRVTLPQQREKEPPPASPPEPDGRLRCPACGSRRLTLLGMTLTDGTPVSFTSCRHCEHRAWAHEGGVLPLSDVLSKARKQLQD